MKKSYFFTMLVSFLTLFSQEIYADNKLTVEDLTINAGEQGVLEVYLTKDNSLLASYQMDLELPDGFTIPQYEEDEEYYYSVETSDEMHKKDGSLSVAEITKGVNISYLNSKTLKSAENGLLLSITIDVASTVSPGTYDLKLSDIQFSTNEDPANTVIMDDVSFTITVPGASTETVSISLANANSYNTYVAEKDLDFTTISDKAEAYIVTAVSATEATLEKVDAVPASEPILIKCLGSGDLEVPVAASTPTVSGNKLATGQPSDGDYLLATDGSKFVLWNGEGTLASNKAYLPAGAISSGAKPFSIDLGTATGISEVKAAKADGAIYSISGVRVAETQKGVYIMNGRKVIVK
jgi:hypothetical protein